MFPLKSTLLFVILALTAILSCRAESGPAPDLNRRATGVWLGDAVFTSNKPKTEVTGRVTFSQIGSSSSPTNIVGQFNSGFTSSNVNNYKIQINTGKSCKKVGKKWFDLTGKLKGKFQIASGATSAFSITTKDIKLTGSKSVTRRVLIVTKSGKRIGCAVIKKVR
ncbi:hypothetical protein HDV00_003893 [Rhizophlyctis rosea]|nr:hypothetical protein HDV00_003893 [Rhizophlyctis rosea]